MTGPKRFSVSGRCGACGDRITRLVTREAKGLYCDQSCRITAVHRKAKAEGRPTGRPKGSGVRCANVTGGGSTHDRTVHCGSCGELKHFDIDWNGRTTERCRCGLRWAVATEGAA